MRRSPVSARSAKARIGTGRSSGRSRGTNRRAKLRPRPRANDGRAHRVRGIGPLLPDPSPADGLSFTLWRDLGLFESAHSNSKADQDAGGVSTPSGVVWPWNWLGLGLGIPLTSSTIN